MDRRGSLVLASVVGRVKFQSLHETREAFGVEALAMMPRGGLEVVDSNELLKSLGISPANHPVSLGARRAVANPIVGSRYPVCGRTPPPYQATVKGQ